MNSHASWALEMGVGGEQFLPGYRSLVSDSQGPVTALEARAK